MDTLETRNRRMSGVGKVELARRLNGPEAKVHVVETESVVCRLKILFGGEALFFSMDGKSVFFDDFSMQKAAARSGSMCYWIEGEGIRYKRAVQTKIREVYYRGIDVFTNPWNGLTYPPSKLTSWTVPTRAKRFRRCQQHKP